MEFSFEARPHEEAAALIEGKPAVSRAVFDGLLPELKGRAFTITGLQSAEVMQRVRGAVAALPRGSVWDEVKGDIVKELEPFLGDGSEQRAELLLRTHGFQAFQASNWRVAQEDEDTTHLQYLATEDSHVRATHLALNGIVLPKDDAFWEEHYPPWEWGCRCRVRPMNPDLVEEARSEDKQRGPDEKLVMEGAALRKLREGTLLRDGQAYDVLPPEGQGGYRWSPDDLRLPIGELQKRYDAEEWGVFEGWAKGTELSPGRETVWEWLTQEPEAPTFGNWREARKWADESLHPDRLGLSREERSALSEYQNGSRALNQALWRIAPLPEELAGQAQLIDDVMARSRLPALKVYAGVSSRWTNYGAGTIVETGGFLSSSLAKEVASENFMRGAVLEIKVPKGARGVYMDELYPSMGNEVEILLASGSRLRILSKALRGRLWHIEAELL